VTIEPASPAPRGSAEGTREVAQRSQLESASVPVPVLTRVSLKNYRSIAGCVVDLAALTLLVGPNGAGKSNFIDGVKITSDALRTTLEHALRERGGINEVRRRSRGHPTHFGIKLELDLAPSWTADYAYQIGAKKGCGFEVQREECRVRRDSDLR
jgi:predicted ATPase